MTKHDRKLLWRIERLLGKKKKVFCALPDFVEHRKFPANGVVVTEEESLRRLRDDGYLEFSSTRWQHVKVLSATSKRLMVADVVEALTDKWTKEKREHERHFIAIASFFVLGVLGIAFAIYREFWK